MAFRFTNPAASPFRSGGLFLGQDSEGNEIGITTQKHAITIAPTRSGKGAALIIPNLRRWQASALVIDPKGENAATTWRDREAMGQKVAVFDPFHEAEIPDRLRASFNPLAAIDVHQSGAREKLQVIADGLVKSHDPRHMEWVEGSRAIIAGVLAYVAETATPETKTFQAMRSLLLLPDEQLHEEAQAMQQCTGAGNLAPAAGSDIITALESTKGMERDFLGGAKRATKWLDSPEIAATLAASTFDLAELKSGKTTVFVVLPFDYIETYSSYMRLFVRCAISAMGRTKGNGECLFLLDEFFALGKIDEIRAALAQMASYGVKLWPFLQDLGQLQELYGVAGSHTFFANSDAHVFMGNTDGLTLEFISKAMDNNTLADLDITPPVSSVAPVSEWERAAATRQLVPPNVIPFPSNGKNALGSMALNSIISGIAAASHDEALAAQAQARANLEARMEAHRASEASERAAYEHTMRELGRPRLAPQEIRELVAHKEGWPVARSMIVFGKGGDIFNLRPLPYFVEDRERAEREIARVAAAAREKAEWDARRPAYALPLHEWYEWGRMNSHPPNVRPIKNGDVFHKTWKAGREYGRAQSKLHDAQWEVRAAQNKARNWAIVLWVFTILVAIMGGGAVLLADLRGWAYMAVSLVLGLAAWRLSRAAVIHGRQVMAIYEQHTANEQASARAVAQLTDNPCGHAQCPIYEAAHKAAPSLQAQG